MPILEIINSGVRFSKDPTTLVYNKPELGHVEKLGADKRWHGTPGPRPFANLTFKYHRAAKIRQQASPDAVLGRAAGKRGPRGRLQAQARQSFDESKVLLHRHLVHLRERGTEGGWGVPNQGGRLCGLREARRDGL